MGVPLKQDIRIVESSRMVPICLTVVLNPKTVSLKPPQVEVGVYNSLQHSSHYCPESWTLNLEL